MPSGIRVTVGILALALAATSAVAQTAPGARAADRQAELERLRGEIARLQAQVSRVQQRARTLEAQLEETRLQLEIQGRRVAEAEAAKALAEARVELLEQRVVELEGAVREVRRELQRRLETLYRLGRLGYLRLLLTVRADESALPVIRQLRFLARRDGEALERFADARARLAAEQQRLEAERGRVEAWVAQEDERRARLEEMRREQTQLLARAERQRRDLEVRAEALVDQERRLSSLVDFLYGRIPGPLSGTPIQDFQGVLDWPAPGRLITGFGPRTDPRYRTRVPHNGLELATEVGSEVRAVYPGRVVFSAPFGGYGTTVIVHHPGRVFTLYARLARADVGEEDVVSLGQAVGTAGDRLYFEIRVENRPVDPHLWLRD
jgi:murein hydrolase activator